MTIAALRNLAWRVGLRSSRTRDRAWLLGQLPRGSTGAEIGVWRGALTQQILHRVDPAELHLIDPWAFTKDPRYQGSWYGGGDARGQRDMDQIYESVISRFSDHIQREVVRIHRARSNEVAKAFEDDYFDWIYVDGDHTFEGVRADLEAYLPKLKPDGLFTGDDYNNAGWWGDGVTRAVDEFAASGRVRVVKIRNHQFILRRTTQDF